MGFRDTIDRLRHASASRHYRPSDRTRKELDESEKKYQKWKNSKKSFKRRNERSALDTAFGILDSMGGYNRPSARRGSTTSIDREAKRRASKRLRYEAQEKKRILREEERRNQSDGFFGGIVYGNTKNTEYATRMFGGKKKRRPVNQSWSNEDFFSNMFKL